MRYEAVGYDFIEIELPQYDARGEREDQINKCNTEYEQSSANPSCSKTHSVGLSADQFQGAMSVRLQKSPQSH
jgi:hypothetical protein